MRRKAVLLGVIATTASVAACSGSNQASQDRSVSSGVRGNAIAFERGEFGAIWVTDADGSVLEQLTDRDRFRAGDGDPVWSSDGQRIAFIRYEGRDADIYVMNADGSDQVPLAASPDLQETGPAWSPDGERIAFSRSSQEGSDVYVMNADGSDQVPLAASPDVQEAGPVWSPDGERIAFSRSGEQGSDVYVINADGSDQDALVDTSDSRNAPVAWFPNGQRVLFIREYLKRTVPAEGSDIYAVSADGNDRSLTDSPELRGVVPTSPALSSGGRIAFLGLDRRAQAPAVWVMSADGSGATPLTGARSAPYSPPSFSPNGRRIAFAGARGGIYVLKAHGRNPIRLSDRVNDRGPMWSPGPATRGAPRS